MRWVVFAFILFITACSNAASQTGIDWMSAETAGLSDDAGTPLPDKDSCEIPASKLNVALNTLAKQTHLKLNNDEAKYYIGHCLPAEPGKTYYLVRAVYGHGGTGGYSVRRYGDNLIIFHGSLGHSNTFSKSALVVSLGFTPKRVIVKASIDE